MAYRTHAGQQAPRNAGRQAHRSAGKQVMHAQEERKAGTKKYIAKRFGCFRNSTVSLEERRGFLGFGGSG